MTFLLLLAGRSAIDLVRSSVGTAGGWMVLPLSLLAAILIGRRMRRQLSVRFDGFGIHFRRRVEARVLPWRTITKVTSTPRWYGNSIRVESESTTLTIAGGYYESAQTLQRFLEAQVRYHGNIEARLATRHITARPPAVT